MARLYFQIFQRFIFFPVYKHFQISRLKIRIIVYYVTKTVFGIPFPLNLIQVERPKRYCEFIVSDKKIESPSSVAPSLRKGERAYFATAYQRGPRNCGGILIDGAKRKHRDIAVHRSTIDYNRREIDRSDVTVSVSAESRRKGGSLSLSFRGRKQILCWRVFLESFYGGQASDMRSEMSREIRALDATIFLREIRSVNCAPMRDSDKIDI